MDKKPIYRLQMEKSTDDKQVFVNDVSYFHLSTYEMMRNLRNANLYTFIGKTCDVYVCDIWGDITEQEALQIVTKWLLGDYATYSLSTGEWTDGKRKGI